jgi:hypothetical protein
MSDAFLPDSTADNGEGIYADTKFAVTDLRDYRAYTTNDGEIKKHDTLYRLIKAGSIFIPKDESFVAAFKDENVQVIGYNETIKGKKKREK